jgi:hypothetical protein
VFVTVNTVHGVKRIWPDAPGVRGSGEVHLVFFSFFFRIDAPVTSIDGSSGTVGGHGDSGGPLGFLPHSHMRPKC